MLTEAWKSPTQYTNRYIVASDLMLNATCNSPFAVTTQTTMLYVAPANYTTVVVPVTTTVNPIMMNNYTPMVTTLCSTTGIENVNENLEKFIIKNGSEKIIIESPYSEYIIQLSDISGKLLLSRKSDSQTEAISLENLSNGIYVVKFSAEGYEQRQKVIKQ